MDPSMPLSKYKVFNTYNYRLVSVKSFLLMSKEVKKTRFLAYLGNRNPIPFTLIFVFGRVLASSIVNANVLEVCGTIISSY